MLLLGYPPACVRGLVHSLPTTTPAQTARRVIRQWIRFLPTSTPTSAMGDRRGSRPMSRSDGNYSRGNDRSRDRPSSRGSGSDRRNDPPYYDKGKGTGKGKWQAQDQWWNQSRPWQGGWWDPYQGSHHDYCDSGSSEEELQMQIEKATKLLLKHDDKYKEIHDRAEAEEQQKTLRSQGEALAMALGDRLDKTLRAVIPPPTYAQSPATFPPTPPGLVAGSPQGGQGTATMGSSPNGSSQNGSSLAGSPQPGLGQANNSQANSEGGQIVTVSAPTLRWVEAALGYKVKLTKTDKDGFVDELSKAIKKHDRELNKLTTSFFVRYAGKGSKTPRLGAERAKGIWELVVNMPQ